MYVSGEIYNWANNSETQIKAKKKKRRDVDSLFYIQLPGNKLTFNSKMSPFEYKE